MKIGFDLDKVFINTPPFVPNILIEKLYKKRANGTLLYRIPGKPEQLVRKVSHMSILRPAMKKNLDALKKISKQDNQLYLISSRFNFLKKHTSDLIKKYDLDKVFDEMYFNLENIQPHIFKNAIIKKLDLDAYVDDDLSLIKYASIHNPKTKFFHLKNKGEFQSLSKNVFAISTLSEMLKHIGEKFKN